jgi:cytochrome P450
MLSTTDLKANTHIFNHPEIYQKSPPMSFEFKTFIGYGIFTVEGSDHKRQRKAISPAFGAQPIREMCDMFISKSMDLKEELEKLFHVRTEITQTQVDGRHNERAGWVEVDMLSWLSRVSLDVIGLAGFDHSFDSITNGDGGLLKELEHVFSECNVNGPLLFFKGWIPLLRLWTLDEDSRRTRRLRQRMRKIGQDIVARKMNAIKTGSADARSKDLLTLLIRANQAEANSTKMSDEEVLGQVPSFIVGGTLLLLCPHFKILNQSLG